MFYQPGKNSAYPIGRCGEAIWPREARRYEIEGVATIRYKLRPDGSVAEPGVVRSSGWALLDEATIALALSCKYTPEQAAQAQGRALPLQFVWKLEGDRIYPGLVRGSCAQGGRFIDFLPFDRRPTDPASGVKVRFLIDGAGKPFRARPEGANIDPRLA